MARSDPGSRSRPARWSRWAGGRVLVVVAALVASVGVVGAQPAAAEARWLQVDAGRFHTCGIRESSAGMGTLWCWGRNNKGQLGLGNTIDRSVPAQVGTDADWIMVTAGDEHTCALKGAGRARYCWGYNYAGRLGLGTDGATDNRYVSYRSPVAAGDAFGWKTLSAGVDATCGIVKMMFIPNWLLCWGDNRHGQLGVGSFDNKLTPTLVAGEGRWTEVSLGWAFACGLRSDGQVPGERYCWGLNQSARLGLGWQSDSSVTVPTAVPGDGSWSTVTTGLSHGCGISVNRRAYCWGAGHRGALGLGESSLSMYAPETRLPGTSWAQIQAGGNSTCGLTTDGTRLCWGANNFGQLGLGDYQDRYSPAEAEEGAVWSSLTFGELHGCGIRKTGALLCWGYNGYGQLGSSQVPALGKSSLPVYVG